MLRVNAGNIRIARFKILTSFKKFANSREHILSHSKKRYSADSKRGFCLSCPVGCFRFALFQIKISTWHYAPLKVAYKPDPKYFCPSSSVEGPTA